MTVAKPKATVVPALIDLPPLPLPGIDDPALLGEWIAFRDDMDELEASLSIDHPELDWTDAMRPLKTRPTGRSGRSRPPTNFHAGKIEPRSQEREQARRRISDVALLIGQAETMIGPDVWVRLDL